MPAVDRVAVGAGRREIGEQDGDEGVARELGRHVAEQERVGPAPRRPRTTTTAPWAAATLRRARAGCPETTSVVTRPAARPRPNHAARTRARRGGAPEPSAREGAPAGP